MLKVSKHYYEYDAVTYAELGINKCYGRVRAMSKKPRYWRVNVRVFTENDNQIQETPLSFTCTTRMRASEIGKYINKEIRQRTDFLERHVKCLVKAYIMTENGE